MYCVDRSCGQTENILSRLRNNEEKTKVKKRIESCLVCGEELRYFESGREMECLYCHKKFLSNASCKNGHYICDECHGKKAIEGIKRICKENHSSDPLVIAIELMQNPFVHMHGPENHVLVGSSLLTAYANAGGKLNLDEALEEMAKRGSQIPGGVCGFWGCCGAASSTGIFVSIVTGTTPLSGDSWGLSNQMTSAALAAIGEVGGPRCCKRNAFLAIEQAVKFCKEHLGVEMKVSSETVCSFSRNNRECIGKRCPYNPVNHQK